VAPTCTRETLVVFIRGQIARFSLNAKSRVQVCAPTCTGEFAIRLAARAEGQRTIDFVSLSAYVASAGGTVAVLNNGAGGKIISGQNNGVEKFSVDGSGNVNTTSGKYQIGGKRVLDIGAAADLNLFLGVRVLPTSFANHH
jgi:hypothetical protein